MIQPTTRDDLVRLGKEANTYLAKVLSANGNYTKIPVFSKILVDIIPTPNGGIFTDKGYTIDFGRTYNSISLIKHLFLYNARFEWGREKNPDYVEDAYDLTIVGQYFVFFTPTGLKATALTKASLAKVRYYRTFMLLQSLIENRGTFRILLAELFYDGKITPVSNNKEVMQAYQYLKDNYTDKQIEALGDLFLRGCSHSLDGYMDDCNVPSSWECLRSTPLYKFVLETEKLMEKREAKERKFKNINIYSYVVLSEDGKDRNLYTGKVGRRNWHINDEILSKDKNLWKEFEDWVNLVIDKYFKEGSCYQFKGRLKSSF